MSSIQQRTELQAQIWKIANDVRGSVDGWDFKQFVLGSLFYRFISENFSIYIEAGDDSVNNAALKDSVITPEIRDDAVKTKGYFIYPSQFFSNVAKNANDNENLNTDFTNNLEHRYQQHLNGNGAKYTAKHKPVKIAYYETFETEQEAVAREKYFKSGSGREWLKTQVDSMGAGDKQ